MRWPRNFSVKTWDFFQTLGIDLLASLSANAWQVTGLVEMAFEMAPIGPQKLWELIPLRLDDWRYSDNILWLYVLDIYHIMRTYIYYIHSIDEYLSK